MCDRMCYCLVDFQTQPLTTDPPGLADHQYSSRHSACIDWASQLRVRLCLIFQLLWAPVAEDSLGPIGSIACTVRLGTQTCLKSASGNF